MNFQTQTKLFYLLFGPVFVISCGYKYLIFKSTMKGAMLLERNYGHRY